MLKQLIRKVRDQEKPRIPRAAIYLRGLEDEMVKRVNVPSTHYQRAVCRDTANALHAEVVDEFVDLAGMPLPHPDMERLLASIDEKRLDYLIVYSLNQLTRGRNRAFALGWRLGSAGVTLVNANAEDVSL
jgi:DNA invertase Pin-like site-specific DNA recombinase